MTGVILEKLSNRKLLILALFLFFMQVALYLIGGLIAPAPANVQKILATKCIAAGAERNFDQWFYSRGEGHCQYVHDFSDARIHDEGITANQIVFTFQFPTPREDVDLLMSRWFQSVVSVLHLEIDYNPDVPMDDDPVLTMDARLGYRNDGDNASAWTEIARSTEIRHLECTVEKKEEGEPMNCDMLPFFELGNTFHNFYLVNIRLPVDMRDGMNIGIGVLKDIYLMAIHANGGFSKVWFALKTSFFPTTLAVLIWYWRRVTQLARGANLLERSLLALGLAMSFLNLPVEWFTLWIYMPYMLLYSDIRQGLFYSVLLCFWIIFAGEHMMDHTVRNRLLFYWKHLSAVGFGCISLFAFEMCERGVQLTNPFYSIWSTATSAKVAFGFVIAAFISACLYIVFLTYMTYKVMRNISAKKASLTAMSKAKRKYYKGLIYRFYFLMVMTLVCGIITVIFFILGHMSEGHWKWGERRLEYNSAFLTGVYGMWNIYVCCLLILYAPSHKKYSRKAPDPACDDTDDQIEFITMSAAPASSSAAAAAASSELTELTALAQKTATD